MKDKVIATIERFSMLRQGDIVTAAVSGGADSVALLDLLCGMIDLNITVRACHVNHCLRGKESDRDEELVRTMCREYGVPLDVLRVEIATRAKATGVSIEVAARDARYEFFDELSQKYGGKVATAHSLSDTAETVIFNMARGTGLNGLCGIPQIRGRVIRPLLACSRQEIEDYCYAHALYFVTDSTNLTDEHTRNFIRHHILPQLSEVNSGALESIGRMTELLRMDSEFISSMAEEVRIRCTDKNGGINIKLLGAEPFPMRARVISAILEQYNVGRSSDRIAAVDSMLFDPQKHTMSLKERRIYAVVRDGMLKLEQRENKKLHPVTERKMKKNLMDGQKILLDDGKTISFSVKNCTDYEIFKNNTAYPLKNMADYDKMNIDIFLRSRKSGDRLRPIGRGCGKTLKKWYNELAVPGRDALCVLADERGAFFAECLGFDERVKPDVNTKKLLTVKITNEKQSGIITATKF